MFTPYTVDCNLQNNFAWVFRVSRRYRYSTVRKPIIVGGLKKNTKVLFP